MRNRIPRTIAEAESCADYSFRVENTKTVLYRTLCHIVDVAKLQQKQIVCLRRKVYRLGKKLK